MCASTHWCVYVPIGTCVCKYTCVCVSTGECVCKYTWVCVCMCLQVHACASTHGCVCLWRPEDNFDSHFKNAIHLASMRQGLLLALSSPTGLVAW